MYWRVYGYDYTDVRECVCKYASTFVRLPHARMDFIYAFNVYIGAGTQAFAAPAFPTGHRRRLRPAVRGCARFCVRFCFGGGCWREGVGWTSWYHAAYSLCSEELQQHARHRRVHLRGARDADAARDEHNQAGEPPRRLLETEHEAHDQRRDGSAGLEHLHERDRDVQVGGVAQAERGGEAQADGHESGAVRARAAQQRHADPVEEPPHAFASSSATTASERLRPMMASILFVT